jgi:hypothetical protein
MNHPQFRVAFATVMIAGCVASGQTQREVNCDKESLQNALNKSSPGDTLRVAGTCRNSVTITVDRLTLDGQGTAVFDGGVPGGEVFGPGGAFNAQIVIPGARGVTISGFTLRNGPGGGIIGRANSAFTVQSTTIQDNYFGMVVENSSHAEIVDSEISGNNDAGLGVINSTVEFRGSVKFNGNTQGIAASGNCDLELPGTQLEASGNKTTGIGISGCSLNIRNFGVASRIAVNDNGSDGLFIGGGQLVIGESFFLVGLEKSFMRSFYQQ